MKNVLVVLGVALAMIGTASYSGAAAATEKEPGLVLRYDFNEGLGRVAKDTSGGGLDGEIIGAEYVPRGDGFALKCDATGCVRIPQNAVLDAFGKPGRSYSIELWFKSAGGAEDPSLAEKSPPGHQAYPWAIRGPYRNCSILFGLYDGRTQVSVAASYQDESVKDNNWHQLVAVRDAQNNRVKLYIDGRLRSDVADALKDVDVSNQGPACIGARTCSTRVDYGGMVGQLDDVAIYSKALDDATVREHYEATGGNVAAAPSVEKVEAKFPADFLTKMTDAAKFVAVEPVASVGRGDIRVNAGSGGQIQIDAGADSYVIESCFSYPGPNGEIGWNGLPGGFSQDNYPDVTRQRGNDPRWKPQVEKASAESVTVRAEGACYRLLRTVQVADGRIDIEDTFTNTRETPTAIVPRHRVVAQQDYVARYAPGQEAACLPVIFLEGARSSLGLVMQDNVSRDRCRPWVPYRGNRCGFQVNQCVLDTGKQLSFAWSVYVMKEKENYFNFINRVRTDWNANFAIQGPCNFLYLTDMDGTFEFMGSRLQFNLASVQKDPSALKAYLKWKRIGVVAVMPWLDYDPGAMDHVLSREEYKQLMQKFIPVIKQADPDIRVIACIETDWVTMHPDRIAGGDKLPRAKVGDSTKMLHDELTREQVDIIAKGMPQWHDSMIRTADGLPFVETCVRGGATAKPIDPAVRVYPAVGNGHYAYIMGQVKFVIEDIGMDGVYFDEFSLGVIGSHRDYLGPWDGISGDIDFTTGGVTAKYVDCRLASVQAKVNLIQYLLSRGKTVVANQYATSREEQSLPVNRFAETGTSLANVRWEEGGKPPAINYLFFGGLNSPIGLGMAEGPLMKGLVTYLRHGMVYYHHIVSEPAMTEDNRDVYGVINSMFPITPVELGEGFIIGKERILTAVSMDRLWKKEGKPVVLLFDMNAKPVDPTGRCEIKLENGMWRLALKLKDWSEIAVVE